MSDELELLDVCANGSGELGAETFLNAEAWVFKGDRERALHAVKRMHDDGTLELLRAGTAIAAWELVVWRRAPHAPETASALASVWLRTSENGLWLLA